MNDSKQPITNQPIKLTGFGSFTVSIILMVLGILFSPINGLALIPCAIGIASLVKMKKSLKKQSDALIPSLMKAERVGNEEDYLRHIRMDEESKLHQIEFQIEQKKQDFNNLKTTQTKELDKIKAEIKAQKNELSNINGEIQISYVSPYIFDDNITSEEYKNQLCLLRTNQNDFMKSNDCIIYSKSADEQTKRTLNNNVRQLLRCFNSETNNIIANVTVKNIDSSRNKIQRVFETLNKLFVTDGVSLAQKCLELKLDELSLIYNYTLKLEHEREQQKAIKEQMIEEEKVRREIEREKAKLDKEETQFKNEISKLMKYLQKASDIEKQLYVDKIKELEDKVKSLESQRENVLQREQNTRAGFVYIISNIGSFGENVYKIGMTRRLEPMDRIRELGSASVPFEFDVHAMIFSDDAPALENILHKTFEKYAVNKVNLRKEFYRIDLHEIERVVKENHNSTVVFTEVAKAEQYRETLSIESHMTA